jgi:hypothetical protein
MASESVEDGLRRPFMAAWAGYGMAADIAFVRAVYAAHVCSQR